MWSAYDPLPVKALPVLLLAAGCAVAHHGPRCADIDAVSAEQFDTWKSEHLAAIAAKKLTPHEQLHLIDAAFDLSFPSEKMKVLTPLLVNPAFCAEAKQDLERRAAGEGEDLRRWILAALGAIAPPLGWRGAVVEACLAGVRVASVEAGSSAAAGGLQPGDVILAVCDRAVADVHAFEEASRREGEVVLDVLRAGARQTIRVR